MLNTLTAMVKVTGSLQKSTEIMKLSNTLVKLPQISQTMREMSMEMTKVCPLIVCQGHSDRSRTGRDTRGNDRRDSSA